MLKISKKVLDIHNESRYVCVVANEKELDMKWFIALGDRSKPRKFFNRETQGFTDVAPVSDYKQNGANRLTMSGEPYKIWVAMCKNAPDLVLWRVSEDQYNKKFT